MATPTFTKAGAKATTAAKLSKDVFGVDTSNHTLVAQAYETYLANGRQSSATTLKRGEVRGGGKKPWKQKGTGRARAGSIRSPIWRGGGITFGPSGDENYTKSLPKKAKKTAIKQALTLANEANKIVVIDSVDTAGKTKELAALLAKVGAKRRILIIDDKPTDMVRRSAQNLENTEVIAANYINVFVVMNADTIVMTKKAVAATEAWLNGGTA